MCIWSYKFATKNHSSCFSDKGTDGCCLICGSRSWCETWFGKHYSKGRCSSHREGITDHVWARESIWNGDAKGKFALIVDKIDKDRGLMEFGTRWSSGSGFLVISIYSLLSKRLGSYKKSLEKDATKLYQIESKPASANRNLSSPF